jgi:hypothetical protein
MSPICLCVEKLLNNKSLFVQTHAFYRQRLPTLWQFGFVFLHDAPLSNVETAEAKNQGLEKTTRARGKIRIVSDNTPNGGTWLGL